MQVNEASNAFGIYRAIVTDVSCFSTTGKIKTRISKFRDGVTPRNLLSGYDSDGFSESISKDILTDIMMPFGGGNDYGMFKLPQVNSTGLVAFIDGMQNRPIWLGSTANSLFNDNEIIESDFPSDKNNNKSGVYFDIDNDKKVFNFDDQNSFVIKTKTNELSDFRKPDTMDWKNNMVENTFVLNSAKAILRHDINDEEHQEIILAGNESNDGKIDLLYSSGDESNRRITVDGSSVAIKNQNGNDEALIQLEDDGSIYITAAENNLGNSLTGSRIDTSIRLTPASVDIKSGQAKISLSRVINNENSYIEINAGNLIINSKNVKLGSSGYALVVSPSPNLNFTLEDGSLLTTADNIRV